LLQEAGKLNHLLFNPGTGYDILTETGFNMDWGFGSSSALTANIAQWAMVDPFELHFRTSGGSGADIAAAISPGPLLYRLIDNKPMYWMVNFKPSFYEHLWLVYLGHKQSTSQSLHDFRIKVSVLQKHTDEMDRITLDMVQAESLKSFMLLIREHEDLLSRLMDVIPVKESHFRDFPGEIKSLGAWGGDFILAASEEKDDAIRDYFGRKEMTPVFSFDKIVL
jgi:mevalonate kinase